jgi:hypothetical protein
MPPHKVGSLEDRVRPHAIAPEEAERLGIRKSVRSNQNSKRGKRIDGGVEIPRNRIDTPMTLNHRGDVLGTPWTQRRHNAAVLALDKDEKLAKVA